MSSRHRIPGFEEALSSLGVNGFQTEPSAQAAGGRLVTKNGAAAVLASDSKGRVAFAIAPGVLAAGKVARLVDRGYQKFFVAEGVEVPATSALLHAVHQFEEELKLLTGVESLFNESLGSTSDVYNYDRLDGRGAPEPTPRRPWETSAAH